MPDRFLVDFWSMLDRFFFQLQHAQPFKSSFFLRENELFIKSIFEFLSMLNFNLMPTWLHFASQNRPKIHQNVDPKRLPIMHPFSLHFWIPKTSHLGFNLEPSWPSVSLQDGPRGLPEPHLRACFFYLRAFLFYLRAYFFTYALMIDFLTIFDWFLADFSWIFGWFVDRFWWVHITSI